MEYPELTLRQLAEVQVAVRHLGRAMKALSRSRLPWPVHGQGWLFALHEGELRACQASDTLLDGLQTLAEWGAAPLPPDHQATGEEQR